MKAGGPFDGLNLLVRHLPCPVLWVREDGQLDRLNLAALQLFGAPDLETAGRQEKSADRKVLGWLGPELDRFTSVADLEYSFEKEWLGPRVAQWFKVHVKRARSTASEPAGTMVVLTDITAQKRLAKALRETHEQLTTLAELRATKLARTNEALRRYIAQCEDAALALKKLSSAVEQTADHVIITNQEGVIEYVNPAFEKLTGFSQAEAIGKTPRIVKSGRMEPGFFEKLWKTILAGKVFRADFINRKKSGELYYEEKIITPIRNDRGRITHFVSTGRDITGHMSGES